MCDNMKKLGQMDIKDAKVKAGTDPKLPENEESEKKTKIGGGGDY